MARPTLQGIVTKAGAMQKTVTMTVERRVMHPKLLKEYTRHKKYLIHDEEDKLKIGDDITVELCRPLSARKRFTLLQINGTEAEIRRRREIAQSQIPAEDAQRAEISKLIKAELASSKEASALMTKTQNSKRSKTSPIPASNPAAGTSRTNRGSAGKVMASAKPSSTS